MASLHRNPRATMAFQSDPACIVAHAVLPAREWSFFREQKQKALLDFLKKLQLFEFIDRAFCQALDLGQTT
jgi:hypothetical protein